MKSWSCSFQICKNRLQSTIYRFSDRKLFYANQKPFYVCTLPVPNRYLSCVNVALLQLFRLPAMTANSSTSGKSHPAAAHV